MQYVDYELNNGEYEYFVTAVFSDGESDYSNLVKVSVDIQTAILDITRANTNTMLGNHPNPFNPETTIWFHLDTRQHALIEIFNIRGQKVRTLVNQAYPAGKHSVLWNGTDDHGNSVGNGIFLYRLLAGDHQTIKFMLYMK